MGDNSTTTENAPKKSWFKELKAEFKKIIWPDKKDLVKQTGVVVVISVCLGVIIALLDMVLQYGIDLLIR